MNVAEQAAPPVNPELAHRLAAADAGVMAAPIGEGATPIAAGEGDESAKWLDSARRYGRMVRTVLPEHARDAWSDENLGQFGVELAACAKHYGWKFGGVINHPLARLAVAGMPLAAPFVMPYVMKALAGADQAPPTAQAAPAASAVSESSPPPAIVKVKPLDAPS